MRKIYLVEFKVENNWVEYGRYKCNGSELVKLKSDMMHKVENNPSPVRQFRITEVTTRITEAEVDKQYRKDLNELRERYFYGTEYEKPGFDKKRKELREQWKKDIEFVRNDAVQKGNGVKEVNNGEIKLEEKEFTKSDMERTALLAVDLYKELKDAKRGNSDEK